jgi:hypothetical protein
MSYFSSLLVLLIGLKIVLLLVRPRVMPLLHPRVPQPDTGRRALVLLGGGALLVMWLVHVAGLCTACVCAALSVPRRPVWVPGCGARSSGRTIGRFRCATACGRGTSVTALAKRRIGLWPGKGGAARPWQPSLPPPCRSLKQRCVSRSHSQRSLAMLPSGTGLSLVCALVLVLATV